MKLLRWTHGKLQGKCNGRAFVKFDAPADEAVTQAQVREGGRVTGSLCSSRMGQELDSTDFGGRQIQARHPRCAGLILAGVYLTFVRWNTIRERRAPKLSSP